MKDRNLEKSTQKDIKLMKEELTKSKLEEKHEKQLKNINNNINININKTSHKTKTGILCSYIFGLINIIYIYLFNRIEKKRILSNGNLLQITTKININSFLEYNNILRKELNYKIKKVNKRKCYDKISRIIIKKNTYIIIMIFFNFVIINNKIVEYNFSNITLKIQGPGNKNILNQVFCRNYHPDIIYINGNQNLTITYKYYFNEINNTVNLIWNNSINNCSKMFYFCNDITEIDLSNFDTLNVINMSYMFYSCSKLYSLNLSNFDT